MNIKLLSAIGAALFIGIILIPLSCLYAFGMLPYSIAATCIGGFLGYLYIQSKEELSASTAESVRVTSQILKESIDKMASQLSDIKNEIHNSAETNSSSIESLKTAITETQVGALREIKVAVAEMQAGTLSIIKETKIAVESAISKHSETVLALSQKQESNSQSIIEDIRQIKAGCLEIKESVGNTGSKISQDIVCSIEALVSGIDSRLVSYKESRDAMMGTVAAAMTKLGGVMVSVDESSKTLASCISEFMCNHDSIIKDVESSVNKIIETQSNLERTLDKLSTLNDDIIRDVTASFKLSVRDMARSIKSSNEDIMEKLEYMQKNTCDTITDFMDSVESSSSNVSKNIEELSKLASVQDSKLEAISKYIPEAAKLSKSEEQLMDNLVKICCQNYK